MTEMREPNGSQNSDAAWRAEPHRDLDKHITIVGPGTLLLYLDNDDVNPDDVAKGLPRILEALNERDWRDV